MFIYFILNLFFSSFGGEGGGGAFVTPEVKTDFFEYHIYNDSFSLS